MSLISASRSVPEEWIVSANSTCLGVRLPSAFSASMLRQDQQAVERRAQLVRHVGQELGLVLGGQRELLGLLLQRQLGLLDLAVLGFDLGLLLGQQARLSPPAPRWSAAAPPAASSAAPRTPAASGLLLQPLVGLGQLLLLALQLLGQRLRLLEQLLGPHVGGDGVQHDADASR